MPSSAGDARWTPVRRVRGAVKRPRRSARELFADPRGQKGDWALTEAMAGDADTGPLGTEVAVRET
ncbi:hypothetical protein N9M16_09660 [Candidatus Dependentiae bacterium]|nr:hypothetical protein [Candidatus Dependentiae bacterium]